MGVTAEYPAILGLYPHSSGYVATWLRGYVATWLRGYVVRVRVSYPYVAISNSNFNSKWLRGCVATRLSLIVSLTLSGILVVVVK